MNEFTGYIGIINNMIVNLFASCVEGLNLVNAQREYDELVAEKPELTSEDVLFIERFVNDCRDSSIIWVCPGMHGRAAIRRIATSPRAGLWV